MSDHQNQKVGAAFWIVGGVFVVWNIFGCFAYLMDVTLSPEAYAETYGAAMAAVRDQYPLLSLIHI